MPERTAGPLQVAEMIVDLWEEAGLSEGQFLNLSPIGHRTRENRHLLWELRVHVVGMRESIYVERFRYKYAIAVGAATRASASDAAGAATKTMDLIVEWMRDG